MQETVKHDRKCLVFNELENNLNELELFAFDEIFQDRLDVCGSQSVSLIFRLVQVLGKDVFAQDLAHARPEDRRGKLDAAPEALVRRHFLVEVAGHVRLAHVRVATLHHVRPRQLAGVLVWNSNHCTIGNSRVLPQNVLQLGRRHLRTTQKVN